MEKLETMELENALTIMKEKYPRIPHNDHAWDLRLQDGERFEKLSSRPIFEDKLCFQKDGFTINIFAGPWFHLTIDFPW
jgi:hypothetical protein